MQDANIVLMYKAFMVPEQLGAAGLEDAPAEVLGGVGEEVLRRSRSDGKCRSRKS
jgi:hypothetical protein